MNLHRWLLPFALAILIATLIASLASVWFAGPSLDTVLALRHAVAGDRHALGESPTAIIAVDDRTLARPDLKDIPFAFWGPQLGSALAAVHGAGPKGIGFDILLGATAEALVPGHDRDFIAALRSAAGDGTLVFSEAAVGGRSFRPHPVFVLAAGGAKNVRPVNVIADRDGIIRKVPLLLPAANGGAPVPGLGLELARRADAAITAPDPTLLLNFADRAPVPIYSLSDVLTCASAGDTAALQQAFGGRVVLIGSTIDIEDRKVISGRMFVDPNLGRTQLPCAGGAPDPVKAARTTVPGVIIHAQAINDLLRSEILRAWTWPAAIAAMLVLAGLGAAAAAHFGARQGSAATLGLGALWTAAAVAAAGADRVLPWIGGLAALAVGYVFMLVTVNLVIDRERKRSVLALSRYLDPAIARDLLSGPRPPELGGEIRAITVWFSDIADFSTVAETLPPQDLVARLNAHFAMVAEAIEAEGGIIDKFIGDAVLAIFGAPGRQPDHAARAVRAAKRVTEATRAGGTAAGGFAMRIGLNSGEALVGNIGTHRRFDYTAIGDTVNVAQRIEAANKAFGTTMLVSQATALGAGEGLGLVRLGVTKVKGREGEIEVWTLGEQSPVAAPNRAAAGSPE
jgi:class 3 adenylate cyclase/CHASE2 domain-containing sensor protein